MRHSYSFDIALISFVLEFLAAVLLDSMAHLFFLQVACLAVVINFVASVSVVFLNTEDEVARSFDEGDTAICRCRAQYTAGSPFTSATFEWQRDGKRVKITDGQTILYGDRFSNASLEDVGDNTMEYRVTIAGLDRYDNGYMFYCELVTSAGVSSGAGGVASRLIVNWNPPSAKCLDVPAKVEKAGALTYSCSVTDVDAKSNGTLSIWKNGERLEEEEPEKSPAQPTGSEYSVSYTLDAADGDVTDDAYECRYRGTGGFEEYYANCTFNSPTCVVEVVADPCPTPGGSVGSRDYISIVGTIGIPLAILVMDAFAF